MEYYEIMEDAYTFISGLFLSAVEETEASMIDADGFLLE